MEKCLTLLHEKFSHSKNKKKKEKEGKEANIDTPEGTKNVVQKIIVIK